MLITDCLGCGGMPEGSYTRGGMDVIMKDNLCWLAAGKSIAGSVLTLAPGVQLYTGNWLGDEHAKDDAN